MNFTAVCVKPLCDVEVLAQCKDMAEGEWEEVKCE